MAEKAGEQVAHRRRVQAMRLVSVIVNSTVTPHKVVSRKSELKSVFTPEPSSWSFIDMDPLIAPDDWFGMTDYRFNAQWPIDHAIALPIDHSKTDFRIGYCRSVDAKEFRGIISKFSPKMALVQNLDFIDGRYGGGGGVFSLIGGRWVNALKSSSPDHSYRGPTDATDAMALHVGMALRHRYEWSVIFQFPTCRIRFSTDPTGVIGMFRSRDMGPGDSRRSPLLHWVARHWRRRRNVAADLIEVRKHLRGREEFEWFGYPVTIIPAEFDIEQVVAGAA